MAKQKETRTNWDKVKWTPFAVAVPHPKTPLEEERARQMEANGARIYKNSIYQVVLEWLQLPPPFGRTAYLSIKTLDKQPRHDWRELQRIKNELVGPEVEAIEMYPAESRLVDMSNQYHLYCFPELAFEKKRFPFGFTKRFLSEGSEPGGEGSRQRDFRPELKPPDVVRQEQLAALKPTDRIAGACPACGTALIFEARLEVEIEGKRVTMHRSRCLSGAHIAFFTDKKSIGDVVPTP